MVEDEIRGLSFTVGIRRVSGPSLTVSSFPAKRGMTTSPHEYPTISKQPNTWKSASLFVTIFCTPAFRKVLASIVSNRRFRPSRYRLIQLRKSVAVAPFGKTRVTSPASHQFPATVIGFIHVRLCRRPQLCKPRFLLSKNKPNIDKKHKQSILAEIKPLRA